MTDPTVDSEELNSRICNGTTVPCEIRESFINGHSRGVGIYSINRLEPETLIWKYNVVEYSEEEAGKVLNSLTSPEDKSCLLYTSPSPRDGRISRMPSSA